MKKFIKVGIGVIFLVLLYSGYYIYSYINIGSAYLAKYVCSAAFVSGWSNDAAIVAAVSRMDLFNTFDIEIDNKKQTVSASLFGLAENTAVFREGLGATLLCDLDEYELLAQSEGWNPPTRTKEDSLPWAFESENIKDVKYDTLALHQAIDKAFDEPDPENYPRNTYAVLVVYKDKIIAERYASGTDHNTPLLGWSMSKSVIGALVGVLVSEGKIDISISPPVNNWQEDDQKSKITWNHLLQMSSGLYSDEDYGDPFSSILQMLYNSHDMGKTAAEESIISVPGSRWYYSSGTTNIMSKAIRILFKDDLFSYWSFPYEKLFKRIGMKNVVFEADESGSFVGSSYMFASARDWARFGLLHLHNGQWDREQILPENWVSYVVTPAENAPRGKYGAQFWLNAGEKNNPEQRWLPDLPLDLYAARGHDGQYLTIIPSLDLVVVRLGNTPFPRGWSQAGFLKGIINSIGR